MPPASNAPRPPAGSLADRVQIANSNETVNAFLGSHGPAWMQNLQPASTSAPPSAFGGNLPPRPSDVRPVRPRGRPRKYPRSDPTQDYAIGGQQLSHAPLGPTSVLPSPSLSSEPSPPGNTAGYLALNTEGSGSMPQSGITLSQISPQLPQLESPLVSNIASNEPGSQLGIIPPQNGLKLPRLQTPVGQAFGQATVTIPGHGAASVTPIAGRIADPNDTARLPSTTDLRRTSSASGHNQVRGSPIVPPPQRHEETARQIMTDTNFDPASINHTHGLMRGWGDALDRHIRSHGGVMRMNPILEAPRYRLLLEACSKFDIFYILIHQQLCIWSRDQVTVQRALQLPSETVNFGFEALFRILGNSKELSEPHATWLTRFPVPPLDVPALFGPRHSVLVQIGVFLQSFHSKWNKLFSAVDSRGYPLLAYETETILSCPSPVLRPVFFRVTRRRIWANEYGPITTGLEEVFLRDQHNEVTMAKENAPQAVREKARRATVQQYTALIAQGRQAQQQILQQATWNSSPINGSASPQPMAHAVSQPPGQHMQRPVLQRVPANGSYSHQVQPQPGLYSETPLQHQWPAPTTASPSVPMGNGSSSQTYGVPSQSHMPNASGSGTTQGLQTGPMGQSFPSLGQIVADSTDPIPTVFAQANPQSASSQVRASSHMSPTGPHSNAHILHPNGWAPNHPPQARKQVPQQFQGQQLGAPQQPLMSFPQSGVQPQFGLQAPRSLSAAQTVQLHAQNQPLQHQQQQNQSLQHQRNQPLQQPQHQPLHQQLNGPQRSMTASTVSSPLNASRVPSVRASQQPISAASSPAGPRVNLIPQNEYPLDAHGWTSVQSSLHLLHERSPKRTVADPSGVRYYQFVSKFPVPPRLLPPRTGLRSFAFMVTDEEKSRTSSSSRALGLPVCVYSEYSIRYRIRMCARKKHDGAEIRENEWLLLPSHWPEHIHITFNGKPVFARRKQHFHHDLPIEISDLIIAGENNVKVSLPQVAANVKPALKYFLAVERVTTVSHGTIKDLVITSRHVSANETRHEVARRLNLSGMDMDDIVVENKGLRVKVADPFSSTMFQVPVRGIDCKHLDCFDLEIWLQTRPRKTKAVEEPSLVDNWKCPICSLDARPMSLRVDDFFVEVQKKLVEQGKGRTKMIDISANGSWTPIEELDDSEDDMPISRPRISTRTSHGTAQAFAPETIEILDD